MEMMDYLYNEEVIMRNYGAEIAKESEARGEARGISIGEARGRRKERESILNQISEQGLLTPELMKVLR